MTPKSHLAVLLVSLPVALLAGAFVMYWLLAGPSFWMFLGAIASLEGARFLITAWVPVKCPICGRRLACRIYRTPVRISAHRQPMDLVSYECPDCDR